VKRGRRRVTVECHPANGEPRPAYLKQLVAVTARTVRLRQLNPRDDKIGIPIARVKNIYRAKDWPELLRV